MTTPTLGLGAPCAQAPTMKEREMTTTTTTTTTARLVTSKYHGSNREFFLVECLACGAVLNSGHQYPEERKANAQRLADDHNTAYHQGATEMTTTTTDQATVQTLAQALRTADLARRDMLLLNGSEPYDHHAYSKARTALRKALLGLADDVAPPYLEDVVRFELEDRTEDGELPSYVAQQLADELLDMALHLQAAVREVRS